MYEIVKASNKDAVAISKMLYASLMNGVDGNFSLSKEKVLNHVIEVITSNDGFSVILKFNDDTVGCFKGQLTPHKYALGYIATELGVYIDPAHRGSDHFVKMLDQFVCWSSKKPDVLMTTFTIGQINATTPYLRHELKARNFEQGDEGYYMLRDV